MIQHIIDIFSFALSVVVTYSSYCPGNLPPYQYLSLCGTGGGGGGGALIFSSQPPSPRSSQGEGQRKREVDGGI